MDPFEARLQFSKLLSTMQPLSLNLQRCVTFALRNREYQEDFGSCILELLDNNDLSIRLNILNFVDALITTSINTFDTKASRPFVRIINENLPSIVSKVVPNNRQGLYNLQGCYIILKNISNVLEFPESTMKQYSNIFKKTTLLNQKEEALAADLNNIGKGVEDSWKLLIQRKMQSQLLTYSTGHTDKNFSLKDEKDLDFTDDEILSRMEADRERVSVSFFFFF